VAHKGNGSLKTHAKKRAWRGPPRKLSASRRRLRQRLLGWPDLLFFQRHAAEQTLSQEPATHVHRESVVAGIASVKTAWRVRAWRGMPRTTIIRLSEHPDHEFFQPDGSRSINEERPVRDEAPRSEIGRTRCSLWVSAVSFLIMTWTLADVLWPTATSTKISSACNRM